jgi:serine/threonine protein kinase
LNETEGHLLTGNFDQALRSANRVLALEPDNDSALQSITRDGTFIGTPVYASPEQVKGESLDERTDLYSLGVVIFEMVTGRRPFNADTAKEMIKMHLETAPPSPLDLRPELPSDFSELILRCLAKDPSDRFQNAAELCEVLDNIKL